MELFASFHFTTCLLNHGLRMNGQDDRGQVVVIISAVSAASGDGHFVLHAFKGGKREMTNDSEVFS